MNIHPQEFVSVRDFSRSTGTYLDDLVAGRRAKYVVMHRNEPRAVVVNVETFERLCNAEARLLRDHPQRVSTGGSGEGE